MMSDRYKDMVSSEKKDMVSDRYKDMVSSEKKDDKCSGCFGAANNDCASCPVEKSDWKTFMKKLDQAATYVCDNLCKNKSKPMDREKLLETCINCKLGTYLIEAERMYEVLEKSKAPQISGKKNIVLCRDCDHIRYEVGTKSYRCIKYRGLDGMIGLDDGCSRGRLKAKFPPGHKRVEDRTCRYCHYYEDGECENKESDRYTDDMLPSESCECFTGKDTWRKKFMEKFMKIN